MKTTNSTLIFFVYIWLFANPLQAQKDNKGIKFKGYALSDALERAREENKPLFIDCYTTWCGPCKMLSKDVFTQEGVGAFYNQAFICISFDMEKQGKDLRKKFQIDAYPTLLFLDAQGRVLQKGVGYMDADQLIELGKKALSPDKNLLAVTQRSQQGDNSYEVIKSLLNNGNKKTEAQTEVLLDKYFKNIESSQWTGKEAWEMIRRYVPIGSEYFKYLLVNEQMFVSLYGKHNVDYTIESKFELFLMSGYKEKNIVKEDAIKYLMSFNHPFAVKAILSDYRHSLAQLVRNAPTDTLRWNKMFAATEKLITLYGKDEIFCLRHDATMIYDPDKNIGDICASITATNHKLAPLMSQHIKCYAAEKLLTNGSLTKKEISTIIQVATEVLENKLVDDIYINMLAKAMVSHRHRVQFLANARQLSSITLPCEKHFCYHTYAIICAQMEDFEEAVKYQEQALEKVKKGNQKILTTYQEAMEKFRNKEPLY